MLAGWTLRSSAAMRLLLLGAFPYPHHQGSQVYFQEQAIALRAAGAEVDLLTYSTGSSPVGGERDLWRGLDGFHHMKPPAWTATASMRSGPSWGKPLADLGLGKTLHDATASRMLHFASYDAIMTHNAEAALVAMVTYAARRRNAPAVIYCVHTLLENELSGYLKLLKNQPFSRTRSQSSDPIGALAHGLKRVIDRAGAALDQRLARRADGWIALTHSAHRVMKGNSTALGELIPPPVPDPRDHPGALDPAATARRHGLDPKSFYLYSGNLDGYQEIGCLAAAAASRGAAGAPIVLASHDPRVLEPNRFRGSSLQPRLVESGPEMLALIAAARATLVMRRAEGGFPIKLANGLAAGTPSISFLEQEWGLSHGENAWIAADGGSSQDLGQSLAAAIERLDREPELRERLGVGARALYRANHTPAKAAQRTLELVERVRRKRDSEIPVA